MDGWPDRSLEKEISSEIPTPIAQRFKLAEFDNNLRRACSNRGFCSVIFLIDCLFLYKACLRYDVCFRIHNGLGGGSIDRRIQDGYQMHFLVALHEQEEGS